MSGCDMIARALSTFTLPPYWMRMRPAVVASDNLPRVSRMNACASCACSGVALRPVQIAHTGDTDDLDYIKGLLDKGVYIGLDRYGLDIFLPTDKRNATAG